MARRDTADELVDLLVESPWWVSVVVGLVVFIVARFVFPVIWPDPKTISGMFAGLVSQFAWVSVIFVFPAIGSYVRAASRRRLLDKQSGIESIRALPWKQFEQLLGEAYRRQGFAVSENQGVGPDGGIDMILKRDGETVLVQCKNWRTYKVGVKVVREMLGLVTAHGATRAVVVASGVYTKEAQDFGRAHAVDLVDGDKLLSMIRSVQPGSDASSASEAPTSSQQQRVCPECGRELVLRVAKRGPVAGGSFWGCSGYPNCRHTEAVAS